MEQANSSNEVLQIDVLSGVNQLGDALQNCMCLFSILSELGDDINNVSKDFCIKEEGRKWDIVLISLPQREQHMLSRKMQ